MKQHYNTNVAPNIAVVVTRHTENLPFRVGLDFWEDSSYTAKEFEKFK